MHDVAEATGLFAENDIKVRINPLNIINWGKQKPILSMCLAISWKAGQLNKKRICREKSLRDSISCFPKSLFCQ